MKVGMIGLGRMGEEISRRMMKRGIEVWGYGHDLKKLDQQYEQGRISGSVYSIELLARVLHQGPRNDQHAIFVMALPAKTVESIIHELLHYCREGDTIIDCGNSNFKDSRWWAREVADLGVRYVDCGISGDVAQLWS